MEEKRVLLILIFYLMHSDGIFGIHIPPWSFIPRGLFPRV